MVKREDMVPIHALLRERQSGPVHTQDGQNRELKPASLKQARLCRKSSCKDSTENTSITREMICALVAGLVFSVYSAHDEVGATATARLTASFPKAELAFAGEPKYPSQPPLLSFRMLTA
jgi:hypothetical protein